MMAYSLTPKERACLEILTAVITSTGIGPSFEELMAGLELKSKSSIHRLVTSLERKGHIHRRARSRRAIALGPRPRTPICPHCKHAIEWADARVFA